MARRQVVEIKCDRCQRVENQEIENREGPGAPASTGPEPELTVSFQGQTIKYHDLCRRCRGAVGNYVKSISMQSPEEKKEEPAPPVVHAEKSGFLGLGKRG